MKKVIPIIFILLCSVLAKGQNMKAIEADLVKSFKRIDKYWGLYAECPSDSSFSFREQYEKKLERANMLFKKKLIKYSSLYRETLHFAFDKLEHEGLSISTSKDSVFRIYSWDTKLCGSCRDYDNVFQYASNGVHSKGYKHIEDIGTEYEVLQTLETKSGNIYIASLFSRYDGSTYAEGVKLFVIKNSILNDTIRLFKTKSGKKNSIFCEYSQEDPMLSQVIDIENEGKTIRLLIANYGKPRYWVTYHFNGQYFERVKK